MNDFEADVAAAASPTSGIVWSYRFLEDGTAETIPPERIEAVLAERRGWIWIHLGLADQRCQTWIMESAPISATAREVLLDAKEHLRLDVLGGEIIGVLPDLHHEFLQASDDIVRLRFAMTERVLVTARRKPVHSIDLTRRSIEAGRLFPTAVSFLEAVIDQFADAVGQLAEKLGGELDEAEDRVLRDDMGDERKIIGRVRLRSVRVHRQLSLLRSVFHRLEHRLDRETPAVAIALRSLTQKLDALDHDINALYERARLLQDEDAAKMTAITNRRLFTLSVLTACLLPPTLVTGFFGMNTKDLPFQTMDGGTWYAFLVAAVAGGATYWVLKRLQAL